MIDFKQKMREENDDFEIINNKKSKKIRFFLIISLTAVFILFGKVIISSPQTNQWLEDNTFWGKIKHLTVSPERKLIGEDEDQINILLLGIGGGNHNGAQLTDTIMLASLKPSTKEAALISLPRDMVAPNSFSNNWRKINSINALAEARKKGSGGEETVKVISNILDIEIAYYLRLDFTGFIKIIDELGGIEVEVERTLSDRLYPIEGQENNPDYYARFHHLYIEKGLQKMDGSLALKYVRSRHASGIEGSDFARGRRQQNVLEAIKNKLISLDMLLKPATLTRVISQLDNSIHTNLNIWEMYRMWEKFKDINKENISNHVFDDSPGGLLTASRGYEGAFILLPRNNNFNEIQNYIANIFVSEKVLLEKTNDQSNQEDKEKKEKQEIKEEIIIQEGSATVVINGTWITGLAANTADNLKNAGFNIVDIGNAPERNLEESFIYDLSYGRNENKLNKLITLTEASLAYDAPSWLEEYQEKEVDFIVLLGDKSNN
jgi:polyisoprenyl-teichoic acid--peptidoglycan teichoic acid transferase